MARSDWPRVAALAVISWLSACGSSDDAPATTTAAGGPSASAPGPLGIVGQGGVAALPEGASAGAPGGGSGGASPASSGGGPAGGGSSGMGLLPGVGGSHLGGSAAGGFAGLAGVAGGLATGGGGSFGLGGSLGPGGGFGAGGSLGLGGGAGGGANGARQFSIRFDYRFDTAGFFDAPERREALQAAAAVWGRLIRDDFSTLPAGTSIRLRNPENRDEYVWVDSIEEDVDDLVVFVGGSAAIPGLGRGGTAGVAESQDPAVQADLATRTGGTDFEPWAGSISFNPTSDFYFDPTPETSDDIPFEQYDFITNAVHELGHVLGFTSGNVTFDALIEGQTFIGAAAQAAYGDPVPLTEDLGHFPQGTLFEGVEPLMDTGQTNGIRSVPSALDLAVFTDLGYEFEP